MAPVAILFAAFFLLPLAQLVVIGGSGKLGWSAYLAVFTETRYLKSFIATIALSAGVTFFTLIVSGITGVFLERNRFPGHAFLTALLTLPLAFPGVVIGFMVIMLAGRQGLVPDFTDLLFGERLVFAYSMAGLFMGYVYFSIPRTILTVMAAAEKLDPRLEEAARSLGAGPFMVVRDVILPALKPAFLAAGAICLRHPWVLLVQPSHSPHASMLSPWSFTPSSRSKPMLPWRLLCHLFLVGSPGQHWHLPVR